MRMQTTNNRSIRSMPFTVRDHSRRLRCLHLPSRPPGVDSSVFVSMVSICTGKSAIKGLRSSTCAPPRVSTSDKRRGFSELACECSRKRTTPVRVSLDGEDQTSSASSILLFRPLEVEMRRNTIPWEFERWHQPFYLHHRSPAGSKSHHTDENLQKLQKVQHMTTSAPKSGTRASLTTT